MVKETEIIPRPPGWGARHTLAVLGFWSFAVNYAMRFNLSMAIVAMVSHATAKNHSIPTTCSSLVSQNSSFQHIDSTEIKTGGEFEWSEAEQGLILGSFFWGYTLTQLPGGWIAQKYGGKWVVGGGLFFTAILTFFIPTAAYLGKPYLIFVRILQGLCEGGTIPAMQVLLSKWLPPDERSRLGTVAYSGVSVGTALTMVSSGYLIQYFGWPAVFYGIGSAGLLWFVLWAIFIFDSPAVHPRVREEEATYIQNSIGSSQTTGAKMPTPWVKIITSPPVLAIFVAQTVNAWGLYTLLTEIPTYMKTVLNFDMKQNSWISASPHICMWLFGTLITYLADLLIQNKYASVVCMRKVCNSIAHWGGALALIGTAISGCDRVLAVLFLNLSVGMLGAGFGGFVVNSIDIAPNFAGVIMGIGNAVCNICGFAAPYVAGQLISGNPSLGNWQLVFFIAAAILIVGNSIFVIFGQGEELSWNRRKIPSGEGGREEIVKMRRFSAISETMQLKVG